MKAKSIKGKSLEEIQTALDQSMSDGFKPTLAFVFLSVKQDRDSISTILDNQGIAIFGATTAGEFIDGNIGKESVAILLLDMPHSHFKVYLGNYGEEQPQRLAKAMAEKALQQFKHPAFILSLGLNVMADVGFGESIIRSVESVTGPDVIIWGGGAGDDFDFKGSHVFSNKESLNKGILLLAIDSDKVIIKGQAIAGNKPVGTEKTITKCVDNWLFEIDNKPALDMVMKYMGLNLSKEDAETFNPGMAIFSLSRAGGEPILRTSGVFNMENKSICIQGTIREGDKIRLTLPPDFEVVEEVIKNASKIQQSEMPEAEALIMFSCIVRLRDFGPMISDEINGVKNVFHVPMAGFFSYGEFGRVANGTNEFHNSTCSWVALKEK